MDLEVSLQLLLRLLPSIILVALAFIAASDRKTRERWTDLLYQAGSLRPEQRSDARVQSNVRWPFFIMAAILLIWPIRYYFYATRTIGIQTNSLTRAVPNSSSLTRGTAPSTNSTTDPAATNSVGQPFGAPPAPPMPGQPGGQVNSATSAAPAPRTNMMGTPLPP
jgi:hypothetical protein